MSIATKLKLLRKKNKLSMQKVADALEIPKGTYVTYEYGTREPNIKTINKIADFYGVSTDYLLCRKIKDANTLIREIEELPQEYQEVVLTFLHMLQNVEEKRKKVEKNKKDVVKHDIQEQEPDAEEEREIHLEVKNKKVVKEIIKDKKSVP
ncbi:MAG: helix-turn-helix transcriptional regulator [Oscillospiraceae bacterium]|nr:helix-turn-helix transcriptional regulator [Oscillospiraceae bacterium]